MHGRWEGRGSGHYPTIDRFDYDEVLTFEYDGRYPFLRYEQQTVLGNGEAGHWEAGVIRPLPDGTIEISNAQDGGRVEVLAGRFHGVTDAGFDLVLESVHLGHDARLVQTVRRFFFRGSKLNYEVDMSTRTTPRPVLQPHLSAELLRHGVPFDPVPTNELP